VLPAAYIEYMQTPVDCAVGSRFYVIDLQLFGGLGFQMQCVRIALAWAGSTLVDYCDSPATIAASLRSTCTASVRDCRGTAHPATVQRTTDAWLAACSEACQRPSASPQCDRVYLWIPGQSIHGWTAYARSYAWHACILVPSV
jgi:hypothetical protein